MKKENESNEVKTENESNEVKTENESNEAKETLKKENNSNFAPFQISTCSTHSVQRSCANSSTQSSNVSTK